MGHNKTCGSLVAVAPAAAAGNDPQSQSQEQDSRISSVALSCLGAASLALATYSFAVSTWRARHDPEDLAFAAGAYTALAALFLCLRRAESLTPDSPAGERRRLHLAVSALSTALSCAFAYRVSLIMPAALVVVIWCMTSFVVLMGFYMLVLCNCKDQRDQGLDDDVGGDAAGEREPFIKKKTRPTTDEIV